MFASMTDDTKTWWSDAIKSLGFPIVMCCALMWGGYQIFTTFVTPMFTKQIQTLEVVTETQKEMVSTVRSIQAEVKEVKETSNVHKQILAELTTSQKEMHGTLKEIEKNTKKP